MGKAFLKAVGSRMEKVLIGQIPILFSFQPLFHVSQSTVLSCLVFLFFFKVAPLFRILLYSHNCS